MSWHDYLDGYLVNHTDGAGRTAHGICEHSAIMGNSDGTIWAAANGFQLENYQQEFEKEDESGTEQVAVDEFQNLLSAVNGKGVTSKKGGIRIHKEKYYFVSWNEDKGVCI